MKQVQTYSLVRLERVWTLSKVQTTSRSIVSTEITNKTKKWDQLAQNTVIVRSVGELMCFHLWQGSWLYLSGLRLWMPGNGHFWEISCDLVRCTSQTWTNKNLHSKSLVSFDLVPELQSYSGTGQHLIGENISNREKTPLQFQRWRIGEEHFILANILLHLCFFLSGRLRRPIDLCRKWLLLCIWPCELGWWVRVKKQARSLYPGDNISQLD